MVEAAEAGIKETRVPRVIELKRPPLSPERDRFRSELEYALGRGMSLLGIDTVDKLNGLLRKGDARARWEKNIEGEPVMIFKRTPKAAKRDGELTAVVCPNPDATPSKITVREKDRGRTDYYELKFGDYSTYCHVIMKKSERDEWITDSREFRGGRSGKRRVLIQLPGGRRKFRFLQIEVAYSAKENFLQAGDLTLSVGDKTAPLEEEFEDLVRPSLIKKGMMVAQEYRTGEPQPIKFEPVRVLVEPEAVLTYKLDPQSHKFIAGGPHWKSQEGEFMNIGDESKGLSVPAEIGPKKFLIRPLGKFALGSNEWFTGSKTLAELGLNILPTILADTRTENYVVPKSIL